MKRLGVNIDHIATVRNARGTLAPDPVEAAFAAINGGADQITIHLREDRRHITDRDVQLLRQVVTVPLNLEMAVTTEMLEIALRTKPEMVTLVPEKRAERTTEGGLSLNANVPLLKECLLRLSEAGVAVSLFVEPELATLDVCRALGAPMVELHTGTFSEKGHGTHEQKKELARIEAAVTYAVKLGLVAHVGHGLNYANTSQIAAIPGVCDLNIVARALFVGLEQAVKEMAAIIAKA